MMGDLYNHNRDLCILDSLGVVHAKSTVSDGYLIYLASCRSERYNETKFVRFIAALNEPLILETVYCIHVVVMNKPLFN